MYRTATIEIVEVAAIPRLAWCARLERGAEKLTLFHGSAVEIRGNGFFEGAWAGNFARDEYDAAFMTGTGAKRMPNGWRFVTPNHTLDRLNVIRKHGVLYISNSLPFVLTQAGEKLDPNVLFYNQYVSSIRFGLRHYRRSIPTRSGLAVTFHYACNLDLTDDGELRISDKPASPEFSSYAHYREYLDAIVAAVARNAADRRRKVRYVPLATVSRGYDSVAAMVVAKKVGCREAVTFRESRGTVSDEDCGTVIAQQLGLAVREFGRLDYRRYANFPEIENSGGPNEFLSFGNALRGRLMFTGFHGDKLWDKHCTKASRDVVRGDASGSSLTEYRLRVGFCHLPVPYVAVDSHPSIHAISNSEEMQPWSVGNLYDRPIARRIAEEAGVPRDAFGQKKRAAGVVVSAEGLQATMSERSLRDFRSFLRSHWTARSTLKVNAAKAIKFAAYLNRGAAKVVDRVTHACGIRFIKVPDLIPRRLAMLGSGNLGKETMLFHWGVERLMARYTKASREAPASPRGLTLEGYRERLLRRREG